jgi:methyl-accepting chemotaxis protein
LDGSDFAPSADISLKLFGSLFTALVALRKGQSLANWASLDNAELTNSTYLKIVHAWTCIDSVAQLEWEMSDFEKSLGAEIENVVQMFDFNGDLSEKCRELLAIIGDDIDDIARSYWDYWADPKFGPDRIDAEIRNEREAETAAFLRSRLADAKGSSWHINLRSQIINACKDSIPLAHVLAASSRANINYYRSLTKRMDRNDPQYARLINAIIDFTNTDLAIMSTCYAHFQREVTREKQVGYTAQFESDIGASAADISEQANLLRKQAAASSSVVHGMLSKASEVATASEQSAVAMREAAQTAAGLIRAIEDTRTEVENAAEVANLATRRAQEAVHATDTLSEQSKSIESILGLIRDIAGQTNLLALNATIEAARAGDAGRGFAVVAQEVKSLANQTAEATDEIAGKIAAIQTATKASVDSNVSIKSAVEDVQHSAERIRHAMEEQAQTVTMITASVDETALAADLMSNTIAAIRADTENVVSEISQLESGFGDVEGKISALQANAGKFAARLVG